jgi:phosphopantothenoylcysteine decarboxylase/phosphopantothenate--cysteine ligase
VVVTAGPTRESIDPVRYLSNESSGRMGFAIAAAAREAGHQVTLIAGPVSLPTPPRVRRIDVVTALEMLRATRDAFRDADALFMAAAVSDWRSARRLEGKWRAKDRGSRTASISLVRNPDILAACGHHPSREGKLVVGFALETGSGISRARRKLKEKGLDFIVLNSEQALNSPRASALILGGDGSVRRLTNRTKEDIADALIDLLGPR